MKSFREYLSNKGIVDQDIIEESLRASGELVEEAFQLKNKMKVLNNIARLISKDTGEKYSPSPVPVVFKNSFGSFTGYYLFNTKNMKAVRLNISDKKEKNNLTGQPKEAFEITSFDVFADEKGPAKAATVHVDLGGLNIVQIIAEFKDVLKNPTKNKKFVKTINLPNPNPMKPLPKTKEVNEEGKTVYKNDIRLIEEAKVVVGDNEYNSMGAAIEALFKMGYERKEIKKLTNCSAAQLSQALKKLGNEVDVVGTPGTKDTFGKTVIKLPKIPEKVPVDELFEDLNDLVKLVIGGYRNSLIVTGMAGVGKCVGPNTIVDVKIKK
jgi:hypothetical protein